MCSLIIKSTGKTIYENTEIHCQKEHTVTQYIMTPLSFQYFCISLYLMDSLLDVDLDTDLKLIMTVTTCMYI